MNKLKIMVSGIFLSLVLSWISLDKGMHGLKQLELGVVFGHQNISSDSIAEQKAGRAKNFLEKSKNYLLMNEALLYSLRQKATEQTQLLQLARRSHVRNKNLLLKMEQRLDLLNDKLDDLERSIKQGQKVLHKKSRELVLLDPDPVH